MDGWNRCLSHGFMPGIILGLWDVAMPTKPRAFCCFSVPRPRPPPPPDLLLRDFHQDSSSQQPRFSPSTHTSLAWACKGLMHQCRCMALAWLRALPVLLLQWCGVTVTDVLASKHHHT